MNKVAIIMYHYVRNLQTSRFNKIKGMDIPLFIEQIEFFKKNYNIIKMEDLINAYYNKTKLPEKSVLLTFDDGYIDHYTNVFPVLDRFKIQGSFFIPAQTFCENKLLDVNKIHFVLASAPIDDLYNATIKKIEYYKKEGYKLPSIQELINKYAITNRFDDKKTVFVKRILQTVLPEKLRGIIASELFKNYIDVSEDVFARELYLNKEQISCMKRNGMFIGVHGYNHYWLGNLSKEEAKNDLEHALNEMNSFIDKNNWVMNFPYGSYNKDTVDLIKKYGCKLALTTNVDICNVKKHNAYELPRMDTIDYPPRSENYKNFEE